MFPRLTHKPSVAFLRTALVTAFSLLCTAGWCQDALPIAVQFEFREPAVDARFDQVPKYAVENDISAELAKSCAKQFPFWVFQPTVGNATSRILIWISLKDSTWSLNALLVHPTGKAIRDHWSTVLYAPGDLDLHVLPKNRDWTPTIKAAFDGLLQSGSQNEILAAFQEFVPLGTQMAAVAAQSTAVLPLKFDKYQALSMSTFRILCDWSGHGVVVLHSTGTGSANDFTPDNPQYKGIWIVHNRWEFAGTPDDISRHAADLSTLKPRAFYLEQFNSPPPDLSVAP